MCKAQGCGASRHSRGRANPGLIACDERGLPGTGKPPAFCATQESESTERFALRIALRSPCSAQARGVLPCTPVERMRSTQGRIYSGPESVYSLRTPTAIRTTSKRIHLIHGGPECDWGAR